MPAWNPVPLRRIRRLSQVLALTQMKGADRDHVGGSCSF